MCAELPTGVTTDDTDLVGLSDSRSEAVKVSPVTRSQGLHVATGTVSRGAALQEGRLAGVERSKGLLGKSGCLTRPLSCSATARGWAGPGTSVRLVPGAVLPGADSACKWDHLLQGAGHPRVAGEGRNGAQSQRVVQAVACGAVTGCGSTGAIWKFSRGHVPRAWGPGRLSEGGLGAQDHWREGRIVMQRDCTVRPLTGSPPSQRPPPSPEPQRGLSRSLRAQPPGHFRWEVQGPLRQGKACCK